MDHLKKNWARLILWGVLAAAPGLALADQTSQASPESLCANTDGSTPPTVRIPACTALLSDGGLTADQQSMVLSNRAWSNSLLGKMAEARADYNRAITLSPNSHVAHNELALFELRLGNLDAALAEYEIALRLRPNAPYSLYGRGIALIRKGRAKDGEDDLAKARLGDSHVDETFASIGMKP
jgi:lipoprotein NlpI